MSPVKGPQRKHPMPWFPFDAEEFLSTSAFILMSLEGRGLYVTLCAWQWLEGFIPGDEKDLARLVGMGLREFKKVWKVEKMGALFLPLLDGTRQNPGIAEARDHQAYRRQRLVEAGRSGGRARSEPDPTFTKEGQAWLKPPSSNKGLTLSSPSSSESNTQKSGGTKPSKAAIVRVFQHWEQQRAKVMKLSRSVPMKQTARRLGRINARLSEGYTEDDLKRAVDGCLSTKFNVQNGHVDCELIFRDQSHVERYMSNAKPGEADDGKLDHLG